mmetsp:Transcript_12233/g.47548  ORF Transcript_12233/g.47548 Transcript_12233/m.47548 type:complete len:170 (-) Transcript_12233:1583-2092(-)
MFRLKRRVQKLRGILWSGCPSHLRPICWKISLGYIPPTFQRHHETLRRKRAEYHSFSAEYFESNRVMNADELDILDQIQIDIPRTDSLRNLLHDERIKMAIERVLFIRAIRNPATSYVQGMTDLVTPFFSGAKTSQNNYEGTFEGTFVLQRCLFQLSQCSHLKSRAEKV